MLIVEVMTVGECCSLHASIGITAITMIAPHWSGPDIQSVTAGDTDITFLAPTGAQGMLMSVCLSVRLSALNLHHSGSDLKTVIKGSSRGHQDVCKRSSSIMRATEPKILRLVTFYILCHTSLPS